jgi:hypothetical protein
VKEKDLDDPADLGVTSHGVRSVRNFMKSFWVKFGRAEACSMAEARRAAGCYFFSSPFFVACYYFHKVVHPLFVVFIGFCVVLQEL